MTATPANEKTPADDLLKADVDILMNAVGAVERLADAMFFRGHIAPATALLKSRKAIVDALKTMT